MSKTVLFVVALVALAAVASAHLQSIPERFRHGTVYRDMLDAEAKHLNSIGFQPNTTASFVTMPLNHNDSSWGTFQDKYYYDTTYWNGTGPCMFYLNGEGPLNSAIGGYMADLAKQLGACTVAIEHRWYGQSYPGDGCNKTLFTSTLNVDQAMADIIFLKEYFSNTIVNKPDMTWFLVGGSYSGGMTVWMNERYPNAFKASWAASGVVRATFAYTEFDGHAKAVTPNECSSRLQYIFKVAAKKFDENRTRFTTIFNLGDSSAVNAMSALAEGPITMVQYSQRTQMCAKLNDMPEDDWAMLQWYETMYSQFFGAGYFAKAACRFEPHLCARGAHGHKFVPQAIKAQQEEASCPISYPNTYSWLWQICSEMAWFQTGYPGSLMSSNITVTFYIDQCREVFYDNTFPDIWKFNKEHHGYHPQTHNNIIATQGSDDPWSTTGLKVNQAPNFPVTTAYCADCGHCSSMMAPKDTDPANLVAQREMVSQFLAKYLQEKNPV